jgi:hypothetical protein
MASAVGTEKNYGNAVREADVGGAGDILAETLPNTCLHCYGYDNQFGIDVLFLSGT